MLPGLDVDDEGRVSLLPCLAQLGPSGKLTNITMENHQFSWGNQLVRLGHGFNSFLYDQRVTEPQDHIELDLGSSRGLGLVAT